MSKETEKKISVIIPFYGNQYDEIIEAIESIFKSNYQNFKLIIIDNGSSSKASDYIKKHFPLVKLIISKKNLGVCGGRNLGIDNLDGDEDYVLFFDSDQIVHPEMFNELIKPFNINKKIGITTPKIYYHQDFIDKNLKNYIWSAGTDINLTTGQVLFRGGEDKKEFQEDSEVAIAPGVLCCKKEVIEKVGKFDETYVSVYEDSDYCFRAKKFGFITYYVSKAYAWHKIYFNPTDSEKKLLTRLFFIGRNRIIFMKKYSPRYLLFSLTFLPMFVGYYFLICLKNLNFKAYLDFLRGTWEGLKFKI